MGGFWCLVLLLLEHDKVKLKENIFCLLSELILTTWFFSKNRREFQDYINIIAKFEPPENKVRLKQKKSIEEKLVLLGH